MSGTDSPVFMHVYIVALTHGFQPSIPCFFYDVLEMFNITSMQLQSSCWERMATYFFSVRPESYLCVPLVKVLFRSPTSGMWRKFFCVDQVHTQPLGL